VFSQLLHKRISLLTRELPVGIRPGLNVQRGSLKIRGTLHRVDAVPAGGELGLLGLGVLEALD
jgi:hypothetical protein